MLTINEQMASAFIAFPNEFPNRFSAHSFISLNSLFEMRDNWM